MNSKQDFFIIGFIFAFIFCAFNWAAYRTGYDSAIELCSSHPVECKALFDKGGNQ